MTTVLITGGAGFIGSRTAEFLKRRGFRPVLVDDLSSGADTPCRSRLHVLDVSSPDLSGIFRRERPEYVIHLAAQVSIRESLSDPLTDARSNILGTINVLESCAEFGVKKIVYASSAAVYGEPQQLPITEEHPTRPTSFYGLSKLAGENYVALFGQHHRLEYAILRYANVYGPRPSKNGEAGVVSAFINCIARGHRPVINGSGRQTRDFVFVLDVARANGCALEAKGSGVFNIGSGCGTSINDLYRRVRILLNQEINPCRVPEKPGDVMHSSLDGTRTRDCLSWEPRWSLDDGLWETLNRQLAPASLNLDRPSSIPGGAMW